MKASNDLRHPNLKVRIPREPRLPDRPSYEDVQRYKSEKATLTDCLELRECVKTRLDETMKRSDIQALALGENGQGQVKTKDQTAGLRATLKNLRDLGAFCGTFAIPALASLTLSSSIYQSLGVVGGVLSLAGALALRRIDDVKTDKSEIVTVSKTGGDITAFALEGSTYEPRHSRARIPGCQRDNTVYSKSGKEETLFSGKVLPWQTNTTVEGRIARITPDFVETNSLRQVGPPVLPKGSDIWEPLGWESVPLYSQGLGHSFDAAAAFAEKGRQDQLRIEALSVVERVQEMVEKMRALDDHNGDYRADCPQTVVVFQNDLKGDLRENADGKVLEMRAYDGESYINFKRLEDDSILYAHSSLGSVIVNREAGKIFHGRYLLRAGSTFEQQLKEKQ